MDVLKKQILKVLIPHINPYLIILFGSTAQGRIREESDIDIAFLSDTTISAYELFTIGQELANEIDREVDLVDLNTSSTVFQAQVVSTGEVLYCNDDKRRMEFEMKVLAMYARLNEERQVVIDAIRESGTVYGE